MTAPVRALRPDQPADAPDAPGVAFSAWNYGHELARSGVPAKLGAGPCAVLHTLASHANKQAQAEVGFGTLARETGQCRRAVIKAIARLIECRAIGRLQRRDDETMVNAVNLYTIFPLEGITAHPAPERRREQARALARRKVGGSEHTVTRGEGTAPSERTVTRGSEHTVTTPSEHTVTRVVNTRAPKASPLSIPLLSIPKTRIRSASADAPRGAPATNGHTTRSTGVSTGASPRTRPRAERAIRAGALEKEREQDMAGAQQQTPVTPDGTGKSKSRERVCKTPEEEEQREELMQAFNDYLRPVDFTELGRCRNEMLRGLREHEFADMASCLRALATSKRFVGQSWVTPVTVVRNVLLWQDAGRPRQWYRVEEYAASKVRQQGGR